MKKMFTGYHDGLKLRYVEDKNSGTIVINVTDFKIMAECMERLEKEQMTKNSKLRWIPVEENLPNAGEIVFVTVKRGYVESGYYDDAREEWWKVDDDGILDVIAWFPSPEPYHN